MRSNVKADRDSMTVMGANAPDPEVIAKPTRRRFTAEYRLRIVEEADRCAEPGEIGRLLRREGLYSSHLSAWRKARRRGVLQSLTPRKRGAKPAQSNPASAQVRRLEAKVARLEKELATAHAILAVRGKSFRAAGIEPQWREQLLIAAASLATKVGVAPACQALGVSRATFYRRQSRAPKARRHPPRR